MSSFAETMHAYNLRNTSIHEAGHAVVALGVGCGFARVRMSRNHGRDASRETVIEGACGHPLDIPDLHRAAIGYAGDLACLVITHPDETADLWNQRGQWSETDGVAIRAVGARQRRQAFDLALSLLRQHWAAVESFAEEISDNYCRKGERCECWFYSITPLPEIGGAL